MRWAVMVVAALLFTAFDSSLMQALRIGGGPSQAIQPMLTPTLAVFVCLLAPRQAALWACWMLGLMIDLREQIPHGSPETIRLLGPWTLGYVLGAILLLQLRSMVFRRNPLTLGVLTAAFMLVAGALAVVIYLLQSWYPGGPLYWTSDSATGEMLNRFFTALYSGLVAIPIGWLLVQSVPLWGFPHIQRVRSYR